MSLTKLTTDLAIIAALSDTPNATEGLTAAQLKAKFDEAAGIIKTYINSTLTTELDTAIDGGTLLGLYRNSMRNSNFDIWQRGTSLSATGGVMFAADGWAAFNNVSSQASTLSLQDGTGVTGSVNCLRYQRNSGQTGVNGMFLAQSMESTESKKFRGKKSTLSFWARIGSGASSSALQVSIRSGTGTDQNVISGFTDVQNEAAQTFTLTTSWQKFTIATASELAGTRNQLAVQFVYVPTGTAGSNDYFEIAQVQLNVGAVAAPYQPKSFAEELSDCMRFYEKTYTYANAPGAITNNSSYIFNSPVTGFPVFSQTFVVRKRIAPTITTFSPTTGDSGKVRDFTASADITTTIANIGDGNFSINHGSTTAANLILGHWTADAEMYT